MRQIRDMKFHSWDMIFGKYLFWHTYVCLVHTKILMSNVINYGWTNMMQVMVIRYKWCFPSKNVNQNVGVYYLTLLSWNVGMSWKIDNFTFKQTSIYSSVPHQLDEDHFWNIWSWRIGKVQHHWTINKKVKMGCNIFFKDFQRKKFMDNLGFALFHNTIDNETMKKMNEI